MPGQILPRRLASYEINMSGVLCCGTRREGKTTLALYLARAWSPTIVVWDPRGSIMKMLGAGNYVEVHSGSELREQLETGEYLRDGVARILIFRSESENAFQELCDTLFPPYFEGYSGGIVLIVDEAGTLQSPHQIHSGLNRVIGQCPDTVLVIQTTHMISEWHGKSRSCMNEMFLFRQVGSRNWQVVAENCGDDVAEQTRNLPPHHLVHFYFDRRDGEQWELWDDPTVWALGNAGTVADNPDEKNSEKELDNENEEGAESSVESEKRDPWES